jgi:uncharacterized membrane protein (DUF373 family)
MSVLKIAKSREKAPVPEPKDISHPARVFIVRGLSTVEDVVYVGLGILLAVAAIVMLLAALKSFATALLAHSLTGQVVSLLDQILLIMLFVELLYTVQVSFREHGLVVEPFLVVALIAAVRRILIITAEVSKLPEATPSIFRQTVLELLLLTVMIVTFVGSLILLQRQAQRKKQLAAEL